MGRWERREDAKNLTLIMASGAVGALITGGVLIAQSLSAHRPPPRVWRVQARPPVMRVYHFQVRAPLNGSDRIYGKVRTVDGRELEGFIRWDRNEGSWTDVLDAIKMARPGDERASGVRFGQIRAIQVQGPDRALVTLRSGEQVEMASGGTDLGEAVRRIVIGDPNHGQSRLDWDQVDVIEFRPAPNGDRPAEGRLYGTLTTRSGHAYTGRIGWDMDEIYSTDILDGDLRGSRQKIPFGAIARIDRDGYSAARVLLRSGREVTLRGTNDVNGENSGITVSDPTLGQVKVGWHDFDHVTFVDAPGDADVVSFDGGRPLSGTVVTESGESFTGKVRWDNDEAYTWEMLNGSSADGAEFEVEFGQIASIRKLGPGAAVTLRDGRSFALSGSNDVNAENGGIYVGSGNKVRRVAWSDFKELRLDD